MCVGETVEKDAVVECGGGRAIICEYKKIVARDLWCVILYTCPV